MGRRGGGCKKRSTQEKLAENAQQNRVVLFYSHAPGKKYREFSNFFMHQQPYMFILPDFATQESLPTQVECEFSEKAIMATKAALMNDPETFAQIVESRNPQTCKELGRRVRNWEQDLWDKHIEEIAFEVVSQKFASEKGLKELLLKTGDSVIAEAAPGDRIWGIGLGCSDPRASNPSNWRGTNILGKALMRTRDHFRSRASETSLQAVDIDAVDVEEEDSDINGLLVEDDNGLDCGGSDQGIGGAISEERATE